MLKPLQIKPLMVEAAGGEWTATQFGWLAQRWPGGRTPRPARRQCCRANRSRTEHEDASSCDEVSIRGVSYVETEKCAAKN